jgi:hypothetical protein
VVSKGPQFPAVTGQRNNRGPTQVSHPCRSPETLSELQLSSCRFAISNSTDFLFPQHNMAVAGAIRSSPAIGLWQTAWRTGGRTQWQQVRMVSSVDRVTQARQRKQAMRKAGSMKDGGEVMGAEQTHQLLLPSK